MHDVLRQRLMRRIESLPESQIYQVLDYIEFLESKYSTDLKTEASALQRLAEKMEDGLRRKAFSPATVREAFQIISAADRALSGVTSAGRALLAELNLTSEDDPSDASRDRSEEQRKIESKPPRNGEGGGEWP